MAYSSKVKQLYCIYLINIMLPSNKHHSTINQTPQMEAKLSINAALK